MGQGMLRPLRGRSGSRQSWRRCGSQSAGAHLLRRSNAVIPTLVDRKSSYADSRAFGFPTALRRLFALALIGKRLDDPALIHSAT